MRHLSFKFGPFQQLHHVKRYLCTKNSKVPQNPVSFPVDEKLLPPRTKIDQQTIEHLEHLSLVDFGNEQGIKILEDSIRFADQIRIVDTTGVEPLVTVLENRKLLLRKDDVIDGNCRTEVMANASVVEEEYFVAPPGNIPLVTKSTSDDTNDR